MMKSDRFCVLVLMIIGVSFIVVLLLSCQKHLTPVFPFPPPIPVVVPVPEPVKPPCPCPGPCKPVEPKKPDSPQPPCCGPVKVLAFTAKWCKPCREAKPELLKDISLGLRVDIVDIDECPQLASQYGVNLVPTFLIYVGGKETERTHDIKRVSALVE